MGWFLYGGVCDEKSRLYLCMHEYTRLYICIYHIYIYICVNVLYICLCVTRKPLTLTLTLVDFITGNMLEYAVLRFSYVTGKKYTLLIYTLWLLANITGMWKLKWKTTVRFWKQCSSFKQNHTVTQLLRRLEQILNINPFNDVANKVLMIWI